MAAINIARVSGTGTRHDTCVGVVPYSSTPCEGVAGVDVGVRAPAGYADGAARCVLERSSVCTAVVPCVGIRPSRMGTRVGGIAPTAVYVGAGIPSVAVTPSRTPAARPVVAPRPPPRIVRVVIRIGRGVADTDGEAPTSSRTPRRSDANPVGIGRPISVTADVGRIVPTCSVYDRACGGRHDRPVIAGSVA